MKPKKLNVSNNTIIFMRMEEMSSKMCWNFREVIKHHIRDGDRLIEVLELQRQISAKLSLLVDDACRIDDEACREQRRKEVAAMELRMSRSKDGKNQP